MDTLAVEVMKEQKSRDPADGCEDYILARAAKLDTATLSDALDRLKICGQCLGIHPLTTTSEITGRAFTLNYMPAEVGGTVGDFIDDVNPGDVVVIANGGRTDVTLWGDIMTLVASQRGIVGTVIDGACRDTKFARELGYSIFSCDYTMRTGKDRVQLEGINVPIRLGPVRVVPGDIVRGDADGVVVLPAARASEILDIAEQIEVAEESIRELVRSGRTLREARKELGYHTLQTPDSK